MIVNHNVHVEAMRAQSAHSLRWDEVVPWWRKDNIV